MPPDHRLYMPMTALKHADATGRLPLDTFYKMIFKHDSMVNAGHQSWLIACSDLF